MTAGRLLRMKTVSEQTGIGYSTLYAWFKKGEGPGFFYFNGHVLVCREDDLTAWIDQQAQAAS